MNVHTVGIALGKTAFQHDRIGSTGKYCDEGAPHAEPTTPADSPICRYTSPVWRHAVPHITLARRRSRKGMKCA